MRTYLLFFYFESKILRFFYSSPTMTFVDTDMIYHTERNSNAGVKSEYK